MTLSQQVPDGNVSTSSLVQFSASYIQRWHLNSPDLVSAKQKASHRSCMPMLVLTPSPKLSSKDFAFSLLNCNPTNHPEYVNVGNHSHGIIHHQSPLYIQYSTIDKVPKNPTMSQGTHPSHYSIHTGNSMDFTKPFEHVPINSIILKTKKPFSSW
jgi:hypothetical protein